MSRLPPASTAIRMRVAPASSEFSSNSFTTDAGRSTTSPAAILLATCSERTWMRPIAFQFPASACGLQVENRARNNGGRRGLAILSPLGGAYAPCPLGCCVASALHNFSGEIAEEIRPESHHHASPLRHDDHVLREWCGESEHANSRSPGYVGNGRGFQ